jgi:predicted nucleotide-binding protein/phosphoserine phosphatase
MAIGIFLDVDITLTKGLIQRNYALHLGVVDEYEKIEKAFQDENINANEFGERLIALFNERNFSDGFAEAHFNNISLQNYASAILNLPRENKLVTIYLVSSGPSYYVKRLADMYQIPQENVLCSKYEFEEMEGGKLLRCVGVGGSSKSEFVESKAINHIITIGIGDSKEFDAPFLSHCDIQILTVVNDSYLSAPNLEFLPLLVRRLNKKLGKKFPFNPRTKPSIFVGCANEQRRFCPFVANSLEKIAEIHPWYQVIAPGETAIQALERTNYDYDFAIFFVTPNDITVIRDKEYPTVRDNIIFETGYFIARLGSKRCFLLAPRSMELRIPSDLSGVTLVLYPDSPQIDTIEDIALEAFFYESMSKIKATVQSLGPIKH